MLNKETILSFFREKIKKPISFKNIVFFMKINHKETRVLKRLLRIMIREGTIVRTRKGLYGPTEEMSLTSGYFEKHIDGYGFVILEKPGQGDIFIPERATLGAMNNDRVLVRIENWQRREGSIVRILERAQTRIAGRLEVMRNGYYVRPKSKYLNFDLLIAPNRRGKAKRGDMVIAEIITYKPPSGRIIKILKKPKEPKDEVESIIDEFNLPRRFPQEVLKEVASIKTKKLNNYEMKRKDLRSLHTVTIDGEKAKDFDDAISIGKTKNGYKLYVHIADVSFFVSWNSAIDSEARKRGTSIYFPDRVIPMLPTEISDNLCSLNPGKERFTITVEIDFDKNGNRVNTKIYPSLIISNERMTYTSVKKILVDYELNERRKYDYLLGDFELMSELCEILRNKRLDRGSLDFDLPEPEIILDLQGRPEAIIKAERNYAHMIIEEFMIAANEAIAEYLTCLGIPILYRIHEQPDPFKVKEILKVIRYISRDGRFLRSKELSDVLKDMKGKPEEEIINYLVLRKLKQARYSHINVGHFGLASKCYTHFTSPIRRYPDLIVHRILRELINKKRITDRRIKEIQKLLPNIAFHASRMERLSDRVEMEIVNAMRAWFMKDKVGEEFLGCVVGINPYGIKVRLKEFYVEGFIHVSYITDDFYQYNERYMSLVGRHTRRSFKIGQNINVRIERVNMEEREVVLSIID